MTTTTTTVVKRVSYEDYCKARKEMQKKLDSIIAQIYPEKKYCKYVEIYAHYEYRQPIQAIVNWSAIGAVPADEAIKFANLLYEASKLAKNFKYNGYKVFYTDQD